MAEKEFYHDIAVQLGRKPMDKDELSNLKIALCKKHGLRKIPTDFDIALNAGQGDMKYLGQLQSKPGRTESGVAVIAAMTKPSDCPHGRCSYCPGGMKSHFGDMPQSYTGKEPATMRAIRNSYDPYLQVFNRLEQYIILGHNCDKAELIIMGGTFIARPKAYRESFVGYCLKAMNDFSALFFRRGAFRFEAFKDFFMLPGRIDDKTRADKVKKRILALKGRCLLMSEQARNERADVRCVAMCIETRPDYCRQAHIDEMLRLGTTRVEMGVQTLDDNILEAVDRGHTVKDTIDATRFLKDSLLKVGFHMMPGLPGSDRASDLGMLKKLFMDPAFRPDALKIYPCMVMPGTKLFKDYKAGKFSPLGTKEAARLIAEFKPSVPEYCRIMRVQRDIPSYVAAAGVDRTNLRQYVADIMRQDKARCRCIRCREPRGNAISISGLKYGIYRYDASGGEEIFISAADPKTDTLAGFCRLRIPSGSSRPEITAGSAGIRELHVYGAMARIGKEGDIQHHGVGKKLLTLAEKIAAEDYHARKMLVISGIGVRGYYRRLGYRRVGPYMAKSLKRK